MLRSYDHHQAEKYIATLLTKESRISHQPFGWARNLSRREVVTVVNTSISIISSVMIYITVKLRIKEPVSCWAGAYFNFDSENAGSNSLNSYLSTWRQMLEVGPLLLFK
jgi:hypothetical protein